MWWCFLLLCCVLDVVFFLHADRKTVKGFYVRAFAPAVPSAGREHMRRIDSE